MDRRILVWMVLLLVVSSVAFAGYGKGESVGGAEETPQTQIPLIAQPLADSAVTFDGYSGTGPLVAGSPVTFTHGDGQTTYYVQEVDKKSGDFVMTSGIFDNVGPIGLGSTGYVVRTSMFGNLEVYETVLNEKGWSTTNKESDAAKIIKDSLVANVREKQEANWEQKKECDPSVQGTFGKIVSNCGWAKQIDAMSQYASGASSLSGLFMSEESLAEWQGSVNNVFSYFEPAGWAAHLCSSKIDEAPKGTAYLKLPNAQGIAVSATIAGECAKQSGNFGRGTDYLYKFVGFVKNPQIDKNELDIEFKITISGPSGTVDLFAKEHAVAADSSDPNSGLVYDIQDHKRTLKPGQTFSLQNRNTFVQLSENEYDTICVHFDNPPEFYESSTVCNVINCHEVETTGYGRPPLSDLPDVIPDLPDQPVTGTINGATGGVYNII